jgi:hypothetical protein
MNGATPSLPLTSRRGAKLIQHRRMKWSGDVVRVGRLRISLLWNINPKKPQGRLRGKLENNIKISSRGCEGVDWIPVAQDRDQWRTKMNFCVSYKAECFLNE